MLNVEELESKYKKYKLKSYTPYVAISLGVSAAILSISFFVLYDFNSKTEIQKELIAQNYEKKEEKHRIEIKEEDNITEQEASETAVIEEISEEKEKDDDKETVDEEREEKIQLAPSLDFIKRIESQTPVDKKDNSVNTTASVEKKVKNPIESVKQESKKEEVALPMVEEVKEKIAIIEKPIIEKPAQNTNTIDIKRRDDEDDIKHVIKRFNVNHNPALSLFVAKKYYQLGDYEQAYNYSLITNDINNNIEASWIVFSKSLVKLGRKDKAVETLKKYISHSDSSQARQLLDEILSGKFK